MQNVEIRYMRATNVGTVRFKFLALLMFPRACDKEVHNTF